MGDDFLVRPRLSRIHYRDHFFHYPLKPVEALIGLGHVKSLRILISYVRARAFPIEDERTFEEWVVNRFGRRLFEIFFETYTEKVWGRPCSEIGAEWAAQRIKNLDLVAAVKGLLSSRGDGQVVTTLIDQFHYPRLGPGMLWERWSERLAGRGVEIRMQAEVNRLLHDDGRVVAVEAQSSGRSPDRLGATLHLDDARPRAGAGDEPERRPVREAAERLQYRDFLTVVLIVDRAELFPDNWIYIHSPEVRVGRIQNFELGPDMVPDPATTLSGSSTSSTKETISGRSPIPSSSPSARRRPPAWGSSSRAACATARSSGPQGVSGLRRRIPGSAGHDPWLARRLREPSARGAQRSASLQQSGSLDADGYPGRPERGGENHDVWAVNLDEEYRGDDLERPPDASGAPANARGGSRRRLRATIRGRWERPWGSSAGRALPRHRARPDRRAG